MADRIRFKKTFLLLLALLAPGCAAPTLYQKAGEPGADGYSEKALTEPGAFEVDFIAEDRTLAFTQYAAYYRAAELTFEGGYRYFQVLKAYNTSRKDKPWGDPKDPTNSTPGVTLFIQCSREVPQGKYYDCWQYLDKAKVPGTDMPYPVIQRKGDLASQPAQP